VFFQVEPPLLRFHLAGDEIVPVEGPDAVTLWDAVQSTLHQVPASADWLLQLFVSAADAGTGFDITLQMDGFLVSGRLTGGRSYFDGIGESFAGSGLAESFAALRDQHYPKVTDKGSKPGPAFIHMKNARFFNTSGHPIPGNEGVWWRGRLSDVAGFFLGALNVGGGDE
jgi:hypothetical protein